MHPFILFTSLLLAACSASPSLTDSKKDFHLDHLAQIKANLAFRCIHEILPEPSTDSDVLFQYARWLEKNNQLKQDKTVDVQIERLYRIAAENGHAKANINLQNGSMRRHYKLTGEENLRLSQQLIDTGVATGYYFVGIFLSQGSAGLQEDQELALRYYRKAADMGSANAQNYVGDKLASSAPDVARQMRRCAAEQGQGDAAVMLSLYLRDEKKYTEAIEVLQMGVAGGDAQAASRLSDAFRGPEPTNQTAYLGQNEDFERADRYEKIWDILEGYSYASPKVPEINDIVPLPPAKLPPWDGKLQWLEAREANVPPPKPGDGLIRQLAEARKLDPATGKPLPGSPVFRNAGFPLRICYSGEPCPYSGYWQVMWPLHDEALQWRDVIRYVEEGEPMPREIARRTYMRPWPFADKITEREEGVQWGQLG